MSAIQFTLTSDESKFLISKALANREDVRRAFRKGICVIHPSSTTYFLFKELTGYEPNVWICGLIDEWGTCISKDMLEKLRNESDSGRFRILWVFEKGELIEEDVNSIIDRMGKGDVYIKSPNAIDIDGNAGVLIGAPDGIGTVGKFMMAKDRGFKIILPASLEKLLPSVDISIDPKDLKYSMGMPVYFRKVEGEVFTEVDAIKTLFGLNAIPIASGGIVRSLTFYAEGGEERVEEFKGFLIKEVKGVKLPRVETPECPCGWGTCKKFKFFNLREFKNKG